MESASEAPSTAAASIERRIAALLPRMTLAEKIGQMNQVNVVGPEAFALLRDAIREGSVGSVINQVDTDAESALQRIAAAASRLGIPLLFGRDVIHGSRTALPIPLGQAATAGVDMDMSGGVYAAQLPALVRSVPAVALDERLRVAGQAALQSVVLLKNAAGTLPLSMTRTRSIAVIGPLADEPYEQLGTWIFDGDPSLSVTGLQGLRDLVGGEIEIRYVRGLETSHSRSTAGSYEALEAARASDAVIMARRSLVLTEVIEDLDAVLFAWHPGTMGAAALADLLFAVESSSGKLPVTFPRVVGQIPIHYNQKRGGKPPSPDTGVLIDEIPVRAPQTSIGNTSYHLDAGYQPLFPFGHGLSYTTFECSNQRHDKPEPRLGEALTVSVDRAFFGRDNTRLVEPGDFHVWVGGSSEAGLHSAFRLVEAAAEGAAS